MSQYQHLHGEINAIKKLDRHYYGPFWFFKDAVIFTHSPDPCRSLRILIGNLVANSAPPDTPTSFFSLLLGMAVALEKKMEKIPDTFP